MTLLTNARAIRLETNETGTAVTGVVVEQEGETETVTGDLVVVSCGAVNSARLLLESASNEHPNGLANGSGQVGRNFMFHDSTAVLALSREENRTVYQKTLGLNGFYNVQMVGKSQAPMFRGRSRSRRGSRRSGRSSGSPATRSTSGSRRRTCRDRRTG